MEGKMVFWGKVNGNENDYLVCYALTTPTLEEGDFPLKKARMCLPICVCCHLTHTELWYSKRVPNGTTDPTRATFRKRSITQQQTECIQKKSGDGNHIVESSPKNVGRHRSMLIPIIFVPGQSIYSFERLKQGAAEFCVMCDLLYADIAVEEVEPPHGGEPTRWPRECRIGRF